MMTGNRFSMLVALLLSAGWGAAAAFAADPLTPDEQSRYADLDARPLQTFTNVDLADYLRLRYRALAATGSLPDAADDVGFFARKGVGQAFRFNACRFDYSESDCVVTVERCVAMALSADWNSYRLLCDRLRHKDGVVDYRNRNLSTLADWLPNTRWLLTDVTDSLAEDESESFTFAVRPKVFVDTPAAVGSKYTRTVFKGSDWKAPPQIVTESYIPKSGIRDVLPALRTGDIVLILYKSSGGKLGCNHMGIVYVGPDEVSMIAGGPPRVRPVPLTGMAGYRTVAGFKFLRLRPDARALAAAESVAVTTRPASPDQEDKKVTAYRAARAKASQ
jgi:hypothetical protein